MELFLVTVYLVWYFISRVLTFIYIGYSGELYDDTVMIVFPGLGEIFIGLYIIDALKRYGRYLRHRGME
jgi:hypothetical protein